LKTANQQSHAGDCLNRALPPVSNLVLCVPSGIYFARATVGGKLIRHSLKTDCLTAAQIRRRAFTPSSEIF